MKLMKLSPYCIINLTSLCSLLSLLLIYNYAFFSFKQFVVIVSLAFSLANSHGVPEPLTSPAQYHIQTDQGPERFFRYQTLSGQYRKEERHRDGSVTGTYGWVDPNGILRLFDYISDAGGYRIESERLYQVSCFFKC